MLKIYNTLTRKKETFRPMRKKRVNLFVCGPTVYDLSHIGHARTYITFDVVAKYLKKRGYTVFYLQNVTDIEDKVINRAKKLNTDPLKLARIQEKEYYRDMETLGVSGISKYARATDYIPQILKQIQTLIKKGFAYEVKNNVYFDITKFPEYGKLSGQKLSRLKHAVRIEKDPNKKHEFDFSLWKTQKRREPFWESPWGKGRPGWHIEDTAITETFFGPQYDIHGSARDLIFPHHESEIAQMEAASGKRPLVRYWMHGGFLTVEGEKMGKSLGNFITIREALSRHSPEVLRFIFLSAHYRSPINYTEKLAAQAKESLDRIYDFLQRLSEITGAPSRRIKKENMVSKAIEKNTKRFYGFMDDDFNTPKALSVIFDIVKEGNRMMSNNMLTKTDAGTLRKTLMEFNEILGIIPRRTKRTAPSTPQNIQELVALREMYRKEKNWGKADKVREKLKEKGYLIEDVSEGPRIKKI